MKDLEQLTKDVHEIKLALLGNEFNDFNGMVSEISKISKRVDEIEFDLDSLKRNKAQTDLYFKVIVFIWSIITGVVLTYLTNKFLSK